MRAILLAAGVGSRIASDIDNQPKSLVDVGGEPLIARTVKMLRSYHMEVTVITGFKAPLLEEVLAPFEVDIVYNPFYAVTNSLGSLWMARDRLKGSEVLIANADVFYEPSLLDRAFACAHDAFLMSDSTRADEGDYFFLTQGDVLLKYGKELAREERNGEYVGLAFLRDDWVKRFRERLDAMVRNGEYGLWWENVLYSFIEDAAQPIHVLDVAGEFWAEVDTLPDYERIKAYLSQR